MSSLDLARQAPRETRAKAKRHISLALLLSSDDETVEALVQIALPMERQALIEDFVAYHESCLMSPVIIDDFALKNLIRFIKTCVCKVNFGLAVSKLIEVASYYENVGNIDSAVRVAEESFAYSETTTDKSLQRKALSRLGACYSRQFDFERSCTCYENALKLAILVGDPLYEFAVLSNVITLFEAMGLTREASRLTEKVCKSYPSGTKDLDLLHLQNSINGFRFAATLDNFTDMERFHRVASRKMREVPQVPEIWRAYFEANCNKRLIYLGRLAESRKRIVKWQKSLSAKSNIRVVVTNLSSSVECAVALSDATWLQELKTALKVALPLCASYPPDYELVLSLLAQVYEHDHFESERELSRAYSRCLQDHVLSVRHRQFFCKLSKKSKFDTEAFPTLKYPSYDVAIPMSEVGKALDLVSQSSVAGAHKSDDFFLDLEGRFFRPRASPSERSLRSADYCIAENWAVAAEFGGDGDGAHCFVVGATASRIAAEMGLDPEHCLLIELACRLHDIGKIGVPGASVHKISTAEWHSSIYMREHSAVGEQLLMSSTDQVLTLAAKIARSHHEWWNGFGFPDSLSGEAIPLEARICAVASEYSTLIGGRELATTWSHQEALAQIATMAGVQFDPLVVQSIFRVEDLEGCKSNANLTTGKLGINRLKMAKAQLDACVSLI